MAATASRNTEEGTITTVHTFTNAEALMLDVYYTIAEAHYSGGTLDEGEAVPFADLTQLQKLQIVHGVMRQLTMREFYKINRRNATAAAKLANAESGMGDV